MKAKKIAIIYAILAAALLLLNERPSIQFYVALIIMILSTWLMVVDTYENNINNN